MSALLFVTMTVLVSLYVFILNTNRYTDRSMKLIMKNMGLNQVAIASEGSFLDYYHCSDDQLDIPEKTTRTMAQNKKLLSRYYVSVLQKRFTLQGIEVVLTGIEPISRGDETREKSNPIRSVRTKCVRLGIDAARRLNVKEGGYLQMADQRFSITTVLSERGSLADFRIFMNLMDAQQILERPGKINAIWSFECLHTGGSLAKIHSVQKAILAETVPSVKQANVASIAEGRYYARKMTKKYLYYMLGAVLITTVMVLVITGLHEVTDRRYETGILIALGAGYGYLMRLHIAKTLLLTLLAGLCGFIIGGYTSVWLTTPFLTVNTQPVAILWQKLPVVLVATSGVALLAEVIPMIHLLRQKPCNILMED